MDFETGQGSFKTTHWTAVLQAARPEAPESIDAFAQLYTMMAVAAWLVWRRGGWPRNVGP
jgi:hypothetical protein